MSQLMLSIISLIILAAIFILPLYLLRIFEDNYPEKAERFYAILGPLFRWLIIFYVLYLLSGGLVCFISEAAFNNLQIEVNYLHANTIQELTGFPYSTRAVVFCSGLTVKPAAVKVLRI